MKNMYTNDNTRRQQEVKRGKAWKVVGTAPYTHFEWLLRQGRFYTSGLVELPQKKPLLLEDKPNEEKKALFLGLSVLAGTATFCIAIRTLGEFIPENWWWIALAIAVIYLPAAFDKLRQSSEPYIIQFARAFRIGFWSILLIMERLIGSNHLHSTKIQKHSASRATLNFDIDST